MTYDSKPIHKTSRPVEEVLGGAIETTASLEDDPTSTTRPGAGHDDARSANTGAGVERFPSRVLAPIAAVEALVIVALLIFGWPGII